MSREPKSRPRRVAALLVAALLAAGLTCGEGDDRPAVVDAGGEAGARDAGAAIEEFDVVVGSVDEGGRFEALQEDDLVQLQVDTAPLFPGPIYAPLALQGPPSIPARFFAQVRVSWEDASYDSTYRQHSVECVSATQMTLCDGLELPFYENPYYLLDVHRIVVDVELSARGWRGRGRGVFHVVY